MYVKAITTICLRFMKAQKLISLLLSRFHDLLNIIVMKDLPSKLHDIQQ